MSAELTTQIPTGPGAGSGVPEDVSAADVDGDVPTGGGGDNPPDGGADGGADAGEDAPEGRIDRVKRLEQEGDIAADYLEELLDIADLDGDLDMDVEGDRASVSIVGADLSQLVGRDGEVLDALQELTRLAVFKETGERCRLMLDIGGFRADLRKNLVELAQDAVADVTESGEPIKLAPMSAFERKVVHDAIAAAGLRSASEGVEPTRCVVVSLGATS